MHIRKITEADRERVTELVAEFYSSDAVDHMIPEETIARNVEYAIEDTPSFVGLVFCENDTIYGFSFITRYFETEVGGMCTGILDLYITPEMRGKGAGKELFSYVFENYGDSKRFRLEAKESNTSAIALYKRVGFEELDYKQFTVDRR